VEDLLPDRQGLVRVVVVVVSTLVAAVLLNSLGFIIVVGLYLAVVLKVVGHRTWLRSALVGFLVAFVIGEGFSRLLDVALPQSPFPFLQQFGI
ncbi:tripartite tricarboxylate transporter TctB family protein, partial [Pseudomonas sp. 100_A]|uniref:tripartite tricarboxylate transporter TctB family protein n=1 Tax=Pseudomonas sp. 100_A TaxID=2813571 RepID=UPI001A9DB669